MKKETLEKIFEYASMLMHGTLSRKLRKDIRCQINEEKTYKNAVFFLGEEFVRITDDRSAVNGDIVGVNREDSEAEGNLNSTAARSPGWRRRSRCSDPLRQTSAA